MALILLHLLPASIYLCLALAGSSLGRNSALSSRGVIAALMFAALVTHAWAIGNMMLGPEGFRFGMAIAMSLTLWLAMLTYSVECLMRPLKQLLTYVAPVAAFFALLPVIDPGHPELIETGNWAFRLHIVVAMCAYSLFTLAVFHALLMATAEKHLHRAVTTTDNQLPPLLTLERVLFRLIGTAFIFLTLTVISGLFFSDEIFGKPFTFTHKSIFGLASWCLFAVLLAGRTLRGWRGKTATRWLLAGFSCLVLAYAGTRFVLEYLLQRSI